MCGILFALSSCPAYSPSPSHVALISLRGPDSTRTHKVTLGSKTLTFTSSLLSVRGSQPTPQPLVDPGTGSVLCWNGEAWRLHGRPIAAGASDTREVFDTLLSAPEGKVDEVLGHVEGEFAFVFYDAPTGVCWYGRDWAGRRSLVARTRRGGALLEVASTGDGSGAGVGGWEAWEEVEAGGGVQRVDVTSGHQVWVTSTREAGEKIYRVPSLNMDLPTEGEHTTLTVDSPEVTSLYDALVESLRFRVRDIQLPPSPDLSARRPCSHAEDVKVAVLFSGGVDCATIARIAHQVLPHHEPIDLLNVAFENPRVVAARKSSANGDGRAGPKKTKGPGEPDLELEPRNSADLDPYSLCPDRSTGLSSFHELCESCPTRPWRFVAINIPYADVLAHRSTVIGLIHPHSTEMDLSIGLAFYFAARGRGTLQSPTGGQHDYATSARILLSGLGADELLGGYTRHATAFRRSGYRGLLDELNLDFQRLGRRNLGRDDRVASHWAKEPRYPFLDDRVVSWAMAAPVRAKCPFGSGGDGNAKKVLRLLAQRLGMPKAATEVKRAVQFGARSAKMSVDSRKAKGTDGLVK